MGARAAGGNPFYRPAMNRPSPTDPSRLLSQERWLRGLARSIARDANEADELVQETWLAALRARLAPGASSGAPHGGSPRAFLAGVLRRRALQRWRSERRRRDRERDVEPRECAPPVSAALERLELGRELARLVVELEEPLRGAIVLRYVEELPVEAIAERLGVPAKTIEARLARGRARLRARWTRRFPGQASGLLGSLIGAPPSQAPPLTEALALVSPAVWATRLGVLMLNTKLVLSVLLLVGAGALAWLAVGRDRPGGPSGPRTAAPEVTRAAPPIEGLDVELAVAESTGPERSAAAPAREDPFVPDAEPRPDPPGGRLRGHLIDPDQRPLPGATLRFVASSGAAVATTSLAGGAFELEVPREPGRVSSADDGLEDLFELRVRPGHAGELLLVSAPHRPLAGRVVDGSGRPLPGVPVALELPEAFSARFDAVLDATNWKTWATHTDDQGSFALERVPIVPGASLVARWEGYAPARLSPPPHAELDVVLVVDHQADSVDSLAGRVVDPDGLPVAGALVSLGERAASTGPEGHFRLSLQGADDSRELVAAAAGHLPGRLSAEADPATGQPRWPDWIELALGTPALSLAGRVVDADGHPRAGVKLWLEDPTEFGVIGDNQRVQLESVSAPPESTWSGTSDGYFPWTATDGEGRFRVEGLLDREYTLGLFDPESSGSARAGPLRAGTAGHVIELTAAAPRGVAGVVVSSTGKPIEGVELALYHPLWGGVHEALDRGSTDSEGRFALAGAERDDLTLWVRGERVVPAITPVSWKAHETGRVVVEALVHFKVQLFDPARADRLRVVDAAGEGLALRDIGADGVLERSSWELVEGRSITLGVSDAAAELVLELEGVEVERAPLALTPGRLELLSL